MRPTLDETMMQVAVAMSRRSTCLKRRVGCVLADARGWIVAASYNGVPRGMPHCNHEVMLTDGGDRRMQRYPHACAGALAGAGSDLCEGVHAEANALIQCRADADAIHSVYTTWSPCQRCTKELLNTGARRIVFLELTLGQPQAGELWLRARREWQLYKPGGS